ncbi:TPA: hypothetical protein DCW61_01670 [Candidatus Uhrbacteria bacterium]|nr:hypothetical protein [Candidatus Uhrbacteria bacterium]
MANVNVSSSPSDRSAQLQQSRAQVRRETTRSNEQTTSHDSKFRPQFSVLNPNLTVKQNNTQITPKDVGISDVLASGKLKNRLAEEQARQQLANTKSELAKKFSLSSLAGIRAEQENSDRKKKQNADMLNGSLMVVGSLTTSLDAASAGTSFLFTLIFRIPILLWKNIQMIYGTHFAKGKSRFIPPISWGPIPMPADKDAILLQIKVVMADLALGITLVVVMFGGFCVVHDIAKFMASPLQTGADLAQGGSEMCLGGIITSIFGL